jgi:hypothetical protein
MACCGFIAGAMNVCPAERDPRLAQVGFITRKMLNFQGQDFQGQE